MHHNGGVDFSFMAMAAAGKNRRDIERLQDELRAAQARQRREERLRLESPIVIMYRRTNGTEASVSCTQAVYTEQINRIAQRGYTILSVVK